MSNSVESQTPLQSQSLAYTNFRNELPGVVPCLFRLADMVLEVAPEAKWDVMLCDDINGRLPAYFIRRVLAESGQPTPTRYIAGSKAYHERFDPQIYRDHYLNLTTDLGSKALNVLIMTEATHHGATLDYLTKVLKPVTHSIETAAVVNTTPRKFMTDYAGGEGKNAGRLVRYAFENIRPVKLLDRVADRIREYTPELVSQYTPAIIKQTCITDNHDLLSLGISREAHHPQVSRTVSNPYTAMAYQTMEFVVQSYCADQASHTANNPIISLSA